MSIEMIMTFWMIGAWLAIAVYIGTLTLVVHVFLKWMTVNTEGAGRRIFVGIHAFTNKAVLYPDPLGREATTNFIDPLVRADAYPNPDRDELRIDIPFTPEGAPAETGIEANRAVAFLRISWSIPQWVPFYDIPNEPGDHGNIIPPNLRVPRESLPNDIVQHFVRQRIEACLPNGIESFVPGAAALVFMNRFTEGEHLVRLFEFATNQTRAVLGALDYREFMRIRALGERDAGQTKKLPCRYVVIRNKRIPLQSEDETAPNYVSLGYANMGDFQRAVSQLLTRVLQLELEPYGVFVNDATLVNVELPGRLVQAHRDREAREHEVEAMNVFSDHLRRNVKRLRSVGMTPDVAGLLAADTMGRESRPGVLGAILAMTNSVINSFRGGNSV